MAVNLVLGSPGHSSSHLMAVLVLPDHGAVLLLDDFMVTLSQMKVRAVCFLNTRGRFRSFVRDDQPQ